MGLDISAYSQIQKVDCLFDAWGEPVHRVTGEPIECVYFQVIINDDFPGRASNLEDQSVYTWMDKFTFRSGSYSGYSLWREQLAKMAGWPLIDHKEWEGRMVQSAAASAWKANSGPFWELIAFSDCEGTLGPDVCKKLAKDFDDYLEKARHTNDESGWFFKSYENWRKAFHMAANNGAILFH